MLSKTQKSPLIEPSEVLVSQSSVLKAEPVITHLGMQYNAMVLVNLIMLIIILLPIIEKLRRNNRVIEEALNERLQLVADILKVPLSIPNKTSDGQEKNISDEPNEILLSAVSQGKLNDLYLILLQHILIETYILGNEIITVLNESLSMTDVDAIAASLGTSNLTSNCSLYKAYATQLSRITKVKPIVASLNSQITELLVRKHLKNIHIKS